MDLTNVLAADAAHSEAQQRAASATETTFSFVKDAIRFRESAQALTKHKLTQIANSERIAAIKQSRVPKSENALEEILSRTTGDATAPNGNIAVLVVSLGENSHAKDLYKYVSEFNDDTQVIGADLFGMNGQSDKSYETLSDKKLLDIVDEIAILESSQAGVTCEVIAKRQPFSDIFTSALKSLKNGN